VTGAQRIRADLVVIGAGAAGLGAAVTARRMGASVILLEANDEPGGLARSFQTDGYTFDWCGHVLHLGGEATRELLESVTSSNDWIELERRSAVWMRDRLVPYPFQLHLAHAPEDICEECLASLPEHAAPFRGDPSDTLLSHWIEASLGPGIGGHFMVPYNEKLAQTSVSELTCEWLGRYAPKARLDEIREGASSRRIARTGYNRRFLYPRQGGIELLWRALAEAGPAVDTGARVRSVDAGRRVITLESGDRIAYREGLLSSMPLPEMARITVPHSRALDAGGLLRANMVTCVNAGLKSVSPDFEDVHWVYLPERRYRAYRVGFYSRFSEAMSPAGREGVYVEIAHPPKATERAVVASAVSDLVALGVIDHEDQVEVTAPVRIPTAYVLPDRNCAHARSAIHDDLAGRGIRMIGRYGRWEYSSLDDALGQGVDAAALALGAEPADRASVAP
jgi:protoporphyrinogen oxidase